MSKTTSGINKTEVSRAKSSSPTTDASRENGSPSASRLKRQSAQVANLKNNMLYSSGFNLANAPQLQESRDIRKSNSDLDIRSMLRFNGNLPSGMQKDGLFIEPALATPQPSYSGLPLESFPNAKIKKESLWPNRKKNKSKVQVDVSVNNDKKEAKYKKRLETPKTPGITDESKIRKEPKPKPRYNKRQADDQSSNSKQSKIVPNPANSPMRSSKRIKVISPKKSITTTALAPLTSNDTRNVSSQDDLSNDEFCSACGGSGMFICCEKCPKSFHLVCCDPPLDHIPEDSWLCRECQFKEKGKKVKQWNDVGIFGQLLNNLEPLIPAEFQLPKGLKNNTFIDVTSDDNGSYDDKSLKPELSLTKLNGNQIRGFNYTNELEIDKLYDSSGNPLLCHKCGLSGLNNRFIVHCDYCPLVWHLDCLDDPMYVAKSLGSKWRCPNHFENLLPPNLFVKRNFKDTPIMDVSLHHQFLKIAQEQNILIKYRDQPYLKTDGKLPTLQEYLQFEVENFNRFNPDYNRDKLVPKLTNTLDNRDDYHEEFTVPDFFYNYPVKNTIVAKPNSKLHKIMAMTDINNRNDNGIKSFVYRIPEELIILDFFTKVKKDLGKKKRGRKPKNPIKKEILNNIKQYEDERVNELKEQNNFIENINIFHEVIKDNPVQQKQAKPASINELLEAASKAYTAEDSSPETLTNQEISELLNIKKLLKLKGKENVMKFLQS